MLGASQLLVWQAPASLSNTNAGRQITCCRQKALRDAQAVRSLEIPLTVPPEDARSTAHFSLVLCQAFGR